MTNTQSPAPGVAAEVTIEQLMALVDEHGQHRWDTAWNERADHSKDAERNDKQAVAARAKIESALRAALQASVAAVEPANCPAQVRSLIDRLRNASKITKSFVLGDTLDQAADLIESLTAHPLPAQVQAAITISDIIGVAGIAGLKAAPVMRKLKAAGFDVTLNQPLAADHIAALIGMPPHQLPAQVQAAEVSYEQFDALWMLFEQYASEFNAAGKQETLTQKRAEIDAWLVNFAQGRTPAPGMAGGVGAIKETDQRDKMLDARRYEVLRTCRGQEHDPLFCVRDEEGNALWGGDLDHALDEAIAYEQDIYGEDADRDALKQSTAPRPSPAPQAAGAPVEKLLTVINDAWANYERMGEVCPFEGQPMIYAATLEEIHDAAIEAGRAGS